MKKNLDNSPLDLNSGMKSEGTNNNKSDDAENVIPASDQSRRAEREQRIDQEDDTERIRTERKSTQDGARESE